MELPAISTSSYASNSQNVQALMAQAIGLNQGRAQNLQPSQLQNLLDVQAQAYRNQQPAPQPKEKAIVSNQRRLIQVFVADSDDNVPLTQCLLYSGEQKLTDLTDQELFFEIDIKTILDKHNAERIKLVNKAVKERVEYLEPARIRDLKMTVVTIASF